MNTHEKLKAQAKLCGLVKGNIEKAIEGGLSQMEAYDVARGVVNEFSTLPAKDGAN